MEGEKCDRIGDDVLMSLSPDSEILCGEIIASEKRSRELNELEGEICKLNEILRDFRDMVDEQDCELQKVESNTCSSKENTAQAEIVISETPRDMSYFTAGSLMAGGLMVTFVGLKPVLATGVMLMLFRMLTHA